MEFKKNIDLHIHSSFSDGSYPPEYIVKIAKKMNLDMIALTDHNTLAGIPSFRRACKKYNQKALAGIELSTRYGGKEIHLLGYFNIDSDLRCKEFSQLKKIIDDYKNIKKKQNEAIIRKIAEVGLFDVSVNDFYDYTKKRDSCGAENYNRVHIAKYMIHKKIVDDIDEAFIYIGEDGDFFVDKETVSIGKAIKAIQAAKGFTVIAHPGEYMFSEREFEKFLRFCKNNGVVGIEAFHPSNSEYDICNVVVGNNLIEKESSIGYSFILTAGSDYHGINKQNKLGNSGDLYDKTLIKLREMETAKTFNKMEELKCI